MFHFINRIFRIQSLSNGMNRILTPLLGTQFTLYSLTPTVKQLFLQVSVCVVRRPPQWQRMQNRDLGVVLHIGRTCKQAAMPFFICPFGFCHYYYYVLLLFKLL